MIRLNQTFERSVWGVVLRLQRAGTQAASMSVAKYGITAGARCVNVHGDQAPRLASPPSSSDE